MPERRRQRRGAPSSSGRRPCRPGAAAACRSTRAGPPAAHAPTRPPSPWPQPENIVTLTKAAGIEVEPYWPALFAKLIEKKSVEDFIVNVGAGEAPWGSGAPAPPPLPPVTQPACGPPACTTQPIMLQLCGVDAC